MLDLRCTYLVFFEHAGEEVVADFLVDGVAHDVQCVLLGFAQQAHGIAVLGRPEASYRRIWVCSV